VKKAIIILLFIIPEMCFAQEKSFVEQANWDKIIQCLDHEEWAKANKLAMACLKKCPKEEVNGNEAAILRYMYLFTESGLMNEKNVDKEEALKRVKAFEGLRIILPGHPLSTREAGFNVIEPYNNNSDTLFVTESNKVMTEIFCFIYVIPSTKMSMDDFNKNIGNSYTISGTLQRITAEGYALPRFKIYMDKAEVKKDN
jgi:hypothetical protein